MYTSQPTSKTEVVSFRLAVDKVGLLKKEAKNRKVSVNVMANQILDAYFDFELSAMHLGFLFLPKKTFRSMVNALRDEEIIILAKGVARSDFVDLTYMMKGKFTLQSFLNVFFAWLRYSNFPYNDQFEEGTRRITINHNMGRKMSIFIRELLRETLQDVSNRVEFEVRNDVLIIHIKPINY